MEATSLAFIGGGRITRIVLEGLSRCNRLPSDVIVTDVEAKPLQTLYKSFPTIKIYPQNNQVAASQDIVFLAVHPPAMETVLSDIKDVLSPDSLVVSLAPKWTLEVIASRLNGFRRIVRMIPNAPSIINHGFNPIAFAPGFPESDKRDLLPLFTALGMCPEVEEKNLEAYAILTAMGPTYFWPQLQELRLLGESFGLSAEETVEGVTRMMEGSLNTIYRSSLSYDEVMDLIPVKPLGEDEPAFRQAYRTKLRGLYEKLKS